MLESHNILIVYTNPKSPEREEEFNTWFNHFHLQQVLKVPGFVRATRYKLSHSQMEWMVPMSRDPVWPYGRDRYLTLYEIDRAADPQAVFQALKETEGARASNDPDNDPVEWGDQLFYEAFTHPETAIALKPPPREGSSARPPYIWMVPSTPRSAEVEDQNNRWYTTEVNLRYPGFRSVARFKLSRTQGAIDSRAPRLKDEWPHGRHSYLALWQIEDITDAIYYRRKAQESGTAFPRYSWTPPMNQMRTADDHLIYEPVTHHVEPIWLHRDA